MIKAVIFDMDGVLIDTVQAGRRTRKELLARYGVDLDMVPDPQGEDHRAASLKTLLASIENHSGIHIDHEEFAGLVKGRMHEALKNAIVDPGLVAFLEDLKSHGIVCAVASSGLRENVDFKLQLLGIGQYFSVVVTAADVKEHKPHPAAYLYTMEKLGLLPSDCVVFEDSLTGVEAAYAAGCRVIGFTQYHPSEKPLPNVVATVKSWNDVSYDELRRILAV